MVELSLHTGQGLVVIVTITVGLLDVEFLEFGGEVCVFFVFLRDRGRREVAWHLPLDGG